MRVFLGIPLGDRQKERLSPYLDSLEKLFPSARWIPLENLHVTVRFFGEFPPSSLDELTSWILEKIRTIGSYPVELDTFGYFQRGKRFVFWIGLKNAEWITLLAKSLSDTFLGLEAENRRFIPHLTLGRYQLRNKNIAQFYRFLKEFKNLKLEVFTQTTFRLILFKSMLGQEGAQYEELQSWPL